MPSPPPIPFQRGVRGAVAPVVILVVVLCCIPGVPATEYTVAPQKGNFTGIQDAIAHAASGDTILVWSGMYHETVRIDKPLTLRGVNTGAGMPVIEPEKRGDAVEITTNDCTFSGFEVKNAKLLSGIKVTTDRNTISGNMITTCSQGLFLEGAGSNVISGNTITRNTRSGIALERSAGNRIEDNTVSGNSIGITLDEYSSSNRISRNNFDNTVNVVSRSITSLWDAGTVQKYQYLGTSQSSRMGNYWSDYQGTDAKRDGIGDTPYVIQIGVNKKAVLAVNQNTADSYPLMDPREFYGRVTVTTPVPARETPAMTASAPAGALAPAPSPGAEPVPAQRILPFRAGGENAPVLSALLVFCVAALLATGASAYLYRRDTADPGRQAAGAAGALREPLIAALYAGVGLLLAVLSLAFMASLAAIPPSSPVITGAWLLCVLCTALSVSSFFLARSAWQPTSLPTVATLHGILAAGAIPFFALFMLYVPDRREVSLFAMIAVLAVSAALPFWQHRMRTVQEQPEAAGRQEPAEPGPAAVPVPLPGTTQPAGSTTVPNLAAAPAPQVSQQSYFPRELEGKYSDIHFIGRGGIAWVYGAHRKTDGNKVAIKIPISFDEMTGKCFLNEIKAWETLRHENIVEVSAVNILPVPYVEMEYVPGSLEAVTKPIPVWKAVHIVRGIADALRYAHGLGIIHRDIKPHNILVTDDLTPKITDWGMSKVLATDAIKSSIAGFSLSYAAPEQVSPSEYGRTDVRTDIYQLGVLFYELVTGSIPFGGESIVSVGNAILREAPIPPSEYNPGAAAVDRIILKCLEKNPKDRYQSAEELLNALAGYLDEDES